MNTDPDLDGRAWIRSIGSQHQGNADARIQLPAALHRVSDLYVGAIGFGWCELADQPGGTRHPADLEHVRVRNKGRLVLAPHLRSRIGMTPERPYALVCKTSPGVLHLLLCDILLLLAPDRPFVTVGDLLTRAPGWVSAFEPPPPRRLR